jgi:hypothetical protein
MSNHHNCKYEIDEDGKYTCGYCGGVQPPENPKYTWQLITEAYEDTKWLES